MFQVMSKNLTDPGFVIGPLQTSPQKVRKTVVKRR
jgi:hypothetical protein